MTEKEITVEDLEETVKRTNEQLNMMEWKMESPEVVENNIQHGVDQSLVAVDGQETCIVNLLKSVSEVKSDYQALRQELEEVQALQRELSTRLRAQLRLVHGKFANLRQRLAAQHQR